MGAPGRADVCRNGHVYLWIEQLDPDSPDPTDRCTICMEERIASVRHYGNINDCTPTGRRIVTRTFRDLMEPLHQDEVLIGNDLVLRTQLFRKRMVELVDVDTIPPEMLREKFRPNQLSGI